MLEPESAQKAPEFDGLKDEEIPELPSDVAPETKVRMINSGDDTVFIKGYKVDVDKIQKICGFQPDDPRCIQSQGLWRDFPIDFEYLGNGYEEDGNLSLVMVFEEGYDRETLEGKEIPSIDSPFDKIFTQGIWVKH